MRFKIAIIVSVLLLAFPASALEVNTGDEPWQTWANTSYVPAPPGKIELYETNCPDPWTVACTNNEQMWIPVRDRHIFLHEVGHLFDFRVMNNLAREWFKQLIGDSRPWVAPRGQPAESPSEKFAEAYSACARHRTVHEIYYGLYNYAAGPKLHRRVCRLIRLVALGG